MSVNDPRYQDMYHLLAEQLVLRPETVIANLNALIQEKNINLELKLLKADLIPPHQYQFAFETAERMVESL